MGLKRLVALLLVLVMVGSGVAVAANAGEETSNSNEKSELHRNINIVNLEPRYLAEQSKHKEHNGKLPA